MNYIPRIAFFADTFHEANGVATLSRQLVAYAQSQKLPFLVVRGGTETHFSREDSLCTLVLKRGVAAFPLDRSLYTDPLLTRHRALVLQHLRDFQPDLVHITGPGDVGFLGLLVAHDLKIPVAASWHTNLHQYLARRIDRLLCFLPQRLRTAAAAQIEKQSLRALLRFYQLARFVMAPNRGMVSLLHAATAKPAFLMKHGVDLQHYAPPAIVCPCDKPFVIGYVGRLTTEKNVRTFAALEQQLLAAGERNFHFLLVGDGGQQNWLRRHMKNVELPGVLHGSNLTAAYARMDAFVFPSQTDTFGLVILEAMACGVPVVLMPEAGNAVGIEQGISGVLCHDFAASILALMRNAPARLAMGMEARKFAASHGWPVVFEHLYRTYSEGLLAKGAP